MHFHARITLFGPIQALFWLSETIAHENKICELCCAELGLLLVQGGRGGLSESVRPTGPLAHMMHACLEAPLAGGLVLEDSGG